MNNIVISKDGNKLGPFNLENARALVLSGQVAANDWAWFDGATDWIPLNQIPGFFAPVQQAVQQAPVTIINTASSAGVGALVEEEQVWAGAPSQILNLSYYLKWVCFLAAVAVAEFLSPAEAQIVALYVLGWLVLGLICIFCVILRVFRLKKTQYVVTTQRVKVVKGIFSKEIEEVELFRVQDTSARQTLFLRLFGLGNITLLSSDKTNADLTLFAVPKPIQLRERLRKEIMNLRQRLNVREMEVMR